MKEQTKKIIAREGLILLGITIISVFFGYHSYQSFWTKIAPTIKAGDWKFYTGFGSGYSLLTAIPYFIIFFYIIYLSAWLIYLLIRFILWAIKTLKEK